MRCNIGGKSIKKIVKIGAIVLLVMVTLPTLSMLFLQNQQVQTKITDVFAEYLSEDLNAQISFSAVHYSFFKRLNLYDLYIEDQQGDTLIYSELCKARIKRFRPDKKDIKLKKLVFENGYLQVIMDENQDNSMQFFVDSIKRDIPPEEKIVLAIDEIEFVDSRFRRIDEYFTPPPTGIDFSDMRINDLNFVLSDFLFKYDTSTMQVHVTNAREESGFHIQDMVFDLEFGLKYMQFRNAELQTEQSVARVPYLDLKYNDPRHFKYFYDSIDVDIISKNSELAFSDLEYLFYQLEPFTGDFIIDGRFHGIFGDLDGDNIRITSLNSTALQFDMNLFGLPSEDSLLMDFSFHELRSTLTELNQFSKYRDRAFFNDSARNESIGELKYEGDFHGYKFDFETNGLLSTQLGDIGIILEMQPDSSRKLAFKGEVSTKGFQLGEFLEMQSSLEQISFDMRLEGYNEEGQIFSTVSGKIDTLHFMDYNYSNIDIEGDFSNRRFDGQLSINDPNIDLIFSGDIDFEKAIPEYNFTMDVPNLRPYYLNLRDDDPEFFASFFLKTHLTGNSVNTLNGNVSLINSLFRRSGSQIQLYDAKLNTFNSPDSSSITLSSDIANAEISGKYNIADLPGLFASFLNQHFMVLPDVPAVRTNDSYFDFKIDLLQVNPLLEFFMPKYSLSDNVGLEGKYRNFGEDYSFTFNSNLPEFSYNNISAENVNILLSSNNEALQARILSGQISNTSGLSILQNDFSVVLSENTSVLNMVWDNESSPSYAGKLEVLGVLNPEGSIPGYSMEFMPSMLVYNDKKFSIPYSRAFIAPDVIQIDSFRINGSTQHIMADGRFSDDKDSLSIEISDLNLEMLNDLNKEFPLNMTGSLSGVLNLKKEYNKALFTSELLAKELSINNEYIGNTQIHTAWDRKVQALQLEMKSENLNSNHIELIGRYAPRTDELLFGLEIANFNLKGLTPYIEGVFDEIDGYANLSCQLDGTVQNPNLNGALFIEESEFLLNSTQTKYFVNDTLLIHENDLLFSEFIVNDPFNNSLRANGNITTFNFTSFFINLDLDATNFNFLNTTRFDNESFYGEIYGTAQAKINGTLEELNIKVSANTEKGTSVKLPLYNPTEIQTTDFITFINTGEVEVTLPPNESTGTSPIILDMDLDITSNTNVQLIFDPKVGDLIDLSGEGPLKLEIDENGVFSMYGDVLIQDGQYLLTLQNVINKRFRVKPGGTISWNGSPTSAILDLDAIYETKASTYSLAPDPTESMKKRVPVHCLLNLQGDLTSPTITPGIELPTAEPETRSLVETNIGTEEDLMRQFFSLLVINNFISPSDIGSNPIGGGATGLAGLVTASEVLSNQLSNWLSQLSTDFDIGVNYRPGDAISSDEVEVALSTQLLNDRVIFSGNLDVVREDVPTQSGIVGDFDLEFMVTDKVSLKAFNRVNDDRVIRPSIYTQGVGVQYRNEFNKLGDLFRRKNKSRENKKGVVRQNTEAVLPEDDLSEK